MNSNWSYSPETLNSGKNRWFFGPCDECAVLGFHRYPPGAWWEAYGESEGPNVMRTEDYSSWSFGQCWTQCHCQEFRVMELRYIISQENTPLQMASRLQCRHFRYMGLLCLYLCFFICPSIVCSTSLMASLIRSVGGFSKYFYQGLWLADLNADVVGM